MATVKQLKTQLDDAGIEYPADARKYELESLLDADPGPVPEEVPGETARSYEDVSGLCRQCGKLADHKHFGV